MNPHNWHGSCALWRIWGPRIGGDAAYAGICSQRMPIPGFVSKPGDLHPGWFGDWRAGQECAVVMLKDFGIEY